MPQERELIGTGRTADVYALSEQRVLRRYRDGSNAEAEAQVMHHVAAHGVPVPAVHTACGADMEMDRLRGQTLLEALIVGARDLRDAASILAELHQLVHAVPARSGAEDLVVLHLDLHPANVFLDDERGPVIIDWNNATDGPADLDAAVTALIMAEASVTENPEVPENLRRAVPEILEAFLRAVDGDPGAQIGAARDYRYANPTLSAQEKRALDEAADLVVSLIPGRSA